MNTQTLLYGVYYGALGIMALYEAFLFFRLREYSYLAYTGFISFGLLHVLITDKVILAQYATEDPFKGIPGILVLAVLACAIQFERLFLNTDTSLIFCERHNTFLKKT